MADEETLKRILEIEREGREMMERARVEAERRVSLAREGAAAETKRAREARARGLQAEFEERKSAIDAEFADRMAEYRKALEGAPLDREALRRLLAAMVLEGRGAGEKP